MDINHSLIEITSTPSDREPHLGLSSRGNQNKERTIEINKIYLIHHQEEEEEEEEDETEEDDINIDSADANRTL